MFRWMIKMVDDGRGEELRMIMQMEVVRCFLTYFLALELMNGKTNSK